MSKEDADILRKAKALIEDEARWTQGADARDEYGEGVRPADPAARHWCAIGAMAQTTATEAVDVVTSTLGGFLYAGAESLGRLSIIQVNDMLGHASVMEMFDRAIALAESAP